MYKNSMSSKCWVANCTYIRKNNTLFKDQSFLFYFFVILSTLFIYKYQQVKKFCKYDDKYAHLGRYGKSVDWKKCPTNSNMDNACQMITLGKICSPGKQEFTVFLSSYLNHWKDEM